MLASCGDSAIFLSPSKEPAKVRVETITAGVMVAPGSEIPFQIARDPVFVGNPESADRLLVELLDAEGILLGEQSYESVDQAGELPPLVLPDLGEGLFVLRTSYLDGEELVEQEQIPFFITSSRFALLGLSSYPASFYPGSGGLLSLNVSMPVGSDPYLEWYLADSLIQAGRVSETGLELEVAAPARSGAYPVTVRLYPFPPVVSQEALPDLDVPAPLSYETQLVVSTEPVLLQSDLLPRRSYLVLHHFLGDLRDSGVRGELFGPVTGADGLPVAPASARAVGDPRLAFEADIFGYRLDGDDGFEMDGLILPVRNGALGPFSLTFRLRPDALPDRAWLLRVQMEDRQMLGLSVDGAGRILLQLGADTRISSPENMLAPGITSVLTVSLWAFAQETLVQLYVDGGVVYSEVIAWSVASASLAAPLAESPEGWMALPGRGVLGGEDGFVGIIDEFGVYFRSESDEPSPDTEIFASAMQQMHGDKLVYAEGFEAATVPEEVTVDGTAEIRTGMLVLGSGSAVSFPAFGFSSEELYVTVILDALAGSTTRFYAEFGPGAGGDALRPAQLVGELIAETADIRSAVLQFSFTHSGPRLSISWPDGKRRELSLPSAAEFAGLRLEVSGAERSPAPVAIESVVAWRERPEIPASLLEPPQPETADDGA